MSISRHSPGQLVTLLAQLLEFLAKLADFLFRLFEAQGRHQPVPWPRPRRISRGRTSVTTPTPGKRPG